MKIVGEMKSNNKGKKHAFLLEKHYFCRYEKILTCISDADMLWFICDGTATERRWEDPPKGGTCAWWRWCERCCSHRNTKGVGARKDSC